MLIDYPKKVSHAELRAILYVKLLEAGLDARLEVTGSHARLDIVVFKERMAVCIIECKSWSLKYLRAQRYQTAKNGRQLTKYREQFGLPLFVCGCRASIEPALHFALKCCS
jgi:hypothetical protein